MIDFNDPFNGLMLVLLILLALVAYLAFFGQVDKHS